MFVGRDERNRPIQISRTVRGGKRDAERVAAELATKPAKASARRTVAEVIAAWRDAKEPTWAPYTQRDVASRAKRIEQDPIAKLPIARLEVADVDGWLARMRRAGVGEGSIRNQLQTLRSALTQAVRWGWISQNPAAQASSARPKRTQRGSMSPAEVRAVLAAAEEVHDMAPVALRLAAVTGARRSELAALRWDDLDEPLLTVDSALVVVDGPDGGELRDDPTKTGDRRRVHLDAATLALVVEKREERRLLGPWMFSESATPPNPGRIGWWWSRSRALSGIDLSWRLHDLRHWSATEGLGMGYSLPMVSGRLGHADPSTTLRVYAHAVSGRDAELAASLGALLEDPEEDE